MPAPPSPARAGIADSRRKEIPGTIRINRDGVEGAGGACITSGLAGEEKNCRRLYELLDRRGNERILVSQIKLHEVSRQRFRDRNYRSQDRNYRYILNSHNLHAE